MKRKSIALACACAVLLFAGCQKKASDRVKIRWFVGLGAGSDEPTYAPQKAVVDKFNASQDEFELVLKLLTMTRRSRRSPRRFQAETRRMSSALWESADATALRAHGLTLIRL